MYYKATVPQFIKMLHNMSTVLDKAARSATDRNFEASVLFESRLAPDQFNFTKQIQIMCDTAKTGVALLTGKEKEMPVHEDNEKTFNELKSRLESVISYLNTFSPSDFDESAQRHILRPRWEGKHLLGEEFLLQHVIPKFYFHFTTAYSILRHNGVNVGKKDYLGAMPFKK
jgi:hypothetical protein